MIFKVVMFTLSMNNVCGHNCLLKGSVSVESSTVLYSRNLGTKLLPKAQQFFSSCLKQELHSIVKSMENSFRIRKFFKMRVNLGIGTNSIVRFPDPLVKSELGNLTTSSPPHMIFFLNFCKTYLLSKIYF